MQLVCLVRSEETQHCRHYRLCNSCPYLAVVIYVTRGSSLLNATSDDKWKGKDRRTIREERIRGDMRTTIGRDYLHWMHTHVKTIWKSMYRMGKYGWQERSGGVFFRVRVCVCVFVCACVVRKRERDVWRDMRLTSRNEFEQEIVAWASRESQQHHPNTTTRLRESPSPLLYITYHGKYT